MRMLHTDTEVPMKSNLMFECIHYICLPVYLTLTPESGPTMAKKKMFCKNFRLSVKPLKTMLMTHSALQVSHQPQSVSGGQFSQISNQKQL